MENGQVVKGDLEYDGRVIFYIIKGAVVPLLRIVFSI